MTPPIQIYRGMGAEGFQPPTAPKTWESLPLGSFSRPEGYRAGPGLVNAANVALMLGQPLLLTGEPGTGKTLFARSLAWELGMRLEIFEVKSTSNATDLFYHYNALAQFHIAQIEAKGGSKAAKSADPLQIARRFLRYNALGAAIIRANPRERVQAWLPDDFVHPGPPRRSIVLLDEIDKAPRDLPNDILSSLDAMAFTVPELGNARIDIPRPENPTQASDFRPILILTSNSEKGLPDAFLRRCIYFNIPFPDLEELRRIVQSRIPNLRDDEPFVPKALTLFERIRAIPGLRKKPATAELLSWILMLQHLSAEAPGGKNPIETASAEVVARTIPCLAKSDEDISLIDKEIRRWAAEPARKSS